MTTEPEFFTPDDYEAWSAEHLDRPIYDFVAGGAGAELTLRDNVAAYDRFRIVPRVLRDVSAVDAKATILGAEQSAPIMISPIGMQRLVSVDAELASAKGAKAAGVGMSVGTASSVSLEDIAGVGVPNLWFQLYWRKDRAITQDLVERAVAAGYRAILLTVDTAVVGRRLRDARNKFQRPAEVTYANFAKYEDPSIKDKAGSAPTYYVANQMDQTLSWKDLEWLKSVAGIPVIVKGVLCAEDAREAHLAGADGVMVSNHGARQLDSVPATIDVLADVVSGMDGKGLVAIDGGVRSATDVAIALALGADVVLVGRPVIWALAQGGEAAVGAYLTGLVDDLVHTMTLLGTRTIEELTPSMVRQLAELRRVTD